jgi:hypothetical protein
MLNRRKLTTLVGLLLAIGLFTAASAQGFAGTTLIIDKFDERTATAIENHTPNEDNTGVVDNAWVVERDDGKWFVEKGALTSNEIVSLPNSSDYRVVIDAGVRDFTAQVDVKVDDYGDQMFGVVARYSGEFSWIMAFHDGVGDIVLGKKVPDENQFGGEPTIVPGFEAGGFQQMARVPFDMSEQKKAHKIKIVTNGDIVQVYANGNLIMTEDETDLAIGTKVGIFSRAVGINKFDKFTVTQDGDGGGGGKGGGKPAKKGPSSPEPSTAPSDDDDKGKGKGKK